MSVFDGRDGHLLYEIFVDDPADHVRALACAGDLDLDGSDDLLVSIACPLQFLCGRTGYVRAYSGRDGHPLAGVQGGVNDHFGFALDGLPDLDGDRIPDFVVGAYLDDAAGHDAGAAIVYSGSPLNRRHPAQGAGR